MDPLLIEIPEQIESERLLLRAPRSGDGTLIFPSVRESLSELKIWMPWASDDYREESSEQWCRRSAASFITREQLQFLMFLRENRSHVGNIGAFKFDWNIPKGEIGYWLRTSHCGRGLMSEAVNALSDFLLDKLQFKRVEIRCDEKNLRSSAVAQRCGFALEGTHRCDSKAADGSLRNTRVYARIAG
ncbi:MAG TPA: GNAT family N-acetyltransferase [Tepidisphaeraceae bacterium]